MNKIYYLIILLFGTIFTQSQTIVEQSFEASGDTWSSPTFSTVPCTKGDGVWDYTTMLNEIRPSDGNQFWGISDLDGSCGGKKFETISLPNIDITTFDNVFFSFDYYAIGFDNNEDLKYELFFDNIGQGEVIVVNGVKGNSDNTNGWKTEIVSIPSTVSDISVILSAKCNKNKEWAGFDNIKLSNDINDNCIYAKSLTLGTTNTENIEMGTTIGSTNSGVLPLPDCANYGGNDVWYTTKTPPSGKVTIETFDVGSNLNTGLAIYTGTCNNLTQIACDDDSGSNEYSTVNLENLPNTEILIRVWVNNNTSSGNFNIVAYNPLCTSATTWSNKKWTNGEPNSYTSAVIDDDFDTKRNGSFESCDCQINNNSVVKITANEFIKIHNNLKVDGSLEIRNEGSLLMTNDDSDVSVTGNVNVHIESAPFKKYDYHYWSSPTANVTIGSALSSSVVNRIFNFNTAISSNTTNGWSTVPTSTVMVPGVGYIGMAPIADNAPRTQDVIFDGIPNNGVIKTPISLSADSTNENDDWNLIGNPYPSSIDAALLLAHPLNTDIVSGTIHLWTHKTQRDDTVDKNQYSTDDYATYTYGTGGVKATSGGKKPKGMIAPGQGFFIEGLKNGNITFNNSMRAYTDKHQFFRAPETKSTEIEKDRIWLNLTNDTGAFNQLLIGFIDGASNDFDRYDGLKYGGGWVSFYSIIENTNLAVNGKEPLTKNAKIKLGFSSYVEEGDSLKISKANTEGKLSSNDYDLMLKDNLLNIFHDLNEADYEFIINEKGVFNDRFELIINKSNISTIENELKNNELIITHNENNLTIATTNDIEITSFRAYDMLGKLIIDESPNESQFNSNIHHISKGTVLLINAELDNNEVIFKKFILIN